MHFRDYPITGNITYGLTARQLRPAQSDTRLQTRAFICKSTTTTTTTTTLKSRNSLRRGPAGAPFLAKSIVSLHPVCLRPLSIFLFAANYKRQVEYKRSFSIESPFVSRPCEDTLADKIIRLILGGVERERIAATLDDGEKFDSKEEFILDDNERLRSDMHK